VLSDEQVRDLHLATLEILERTGVEVRDEKAHELLRRAGARVDGDRVRIPAPLVSQALHTAPERVVLSARTGERVMPLEEGRVFFGTGSDTPNTIDPETRQHRPARRRDITQIARLCDALPNIGFIMSMGIASDVPAETCFLHGFAAMLAGSSKPIIFTAQDERDLADIYEIACAVAGGEEALRSNPFLTHYAEPISPLIHSPNGVRKLVFCAERQLPVAYVSGMSAGATGPVTLAGACALANAECLSGLVIHQLVSPGAPFIYGANVSVMDMASLGYVYGGPEFSLTNAAFADLARCYRLPVWGLAGSSDSKVVDAQAGLEAMCSINTAILARGNLVHDVGYLESGLTSSMEMIAVCDEIISMLTILHRGLPMDADRLAVELVDAVGPGRHFLDTDHTLRYFRTEHFLPRLLDRNNCARWTERGCEDLADRANRRVRELLASHRPAPLSETAQAAIEKVLAEPRAARAEA
jgi:trimethylamine--corrinoid protein Co-methyltransferase